MAAEPGTEDLHGAYYQRNQFVRSKPPQHVLHLSSLTRVCYPALSLHIIILSGRVNMIYGTLISVEIRSEGSKSFSVHCYSYRCRYLAFISYMFHSFFTNLVKWDLAADIIFKDLFFFFFFFCLLNIWEFSVRLNLLRSVGFQFVFIRHVFHIYLYASFMEWQYTANDCLMEKKKKKWCIGRLMRTVTLPVLPALRVWAIRWFSCFTWSEKPL